MKKFKVKVELEGTNQKWSTEHNFSDFYANLGHLDKELALKAIKGLAEKMEQELKEGNYV